MFKILQKLINESKSANIETSVDITKPGEIGKIILYNNYLYIYNGSRWVSFLGQNADLNILTTPIPFEGLIYENTQNGIKYYRKPINNPPSSVVKSWAGVTFFRSNANIITPYTHTISVYVISPKDNVTIMLKIDNKHNENIFQKKSSTLPTKNVLTKLTFDFDANTGNIYDMISIFFDFLQEGDNSIYRLGNYNIYLIKNYFIKLYYENKF